MTATAPEAEAAAIQRAAFRDEGASVPFDFPAVERALGEIPLELRDGEVARLALALDRLLDFIVGNRTVSPERATAIGRRTLAVCWLLSPEKFEGRSLSRLAAELGVSPPALAQVTGNFSRAFGLRFRQQAQSRGVFRPAAGDHQRHAVPIHYKSLEVDDGEH